MGTDIDEILGIATAPDGKDASTNRGPAAGFVASATSVLVLGIILGVFTSDFASKFVGAILIVLALLEFVLSSTAVVSRKAAAFTIFLSMAVLWSLWLVMTFFAIEPYFVVVGGRETARREFMREFKDADGLFKAMSADDDLAEQIDRDMEYAQRSIGFMKSHWAGQWRSSVRLFTLSSMDDAAITALDQGRIAVFMPGIIQTFALAVFAAFVLFNRRASQDRPTTSGNEMTATDSAPGPKTESDGPTPN